jgi:hypothetical protein
MVMFTPGGVDSDPRLGQALRRVRTRYTLRVLVRGLATFGAGGLLGVAFSAYALDVFRYSRGTIQTVTAIFYLWLLLLAGRFVAAPLWRGRRQASDAAIARYIEEHEPGLDAALRSAVDAAAHPSTTSSPASRPSIFPARSSGRRCGRPP